jgi:hypothetical protein
MSRLFDRAGMSTTTTGTGTLTLGSALGNVSPNLAGFLSFAGAGVTDGLDVSYLILDANNGWEVGHGTYTASGTTLTRNVTKSSNSNSAINLSGNAQVFITIRAEDLLQTDASGNITQVVNIINSTASTSSSTGALKVTTGGIGIGGAGYFGDLVSATKFVPTQTITSTAAQGNFDCSGTGITVANGSDSGALWGGIGPNGLVFVICVETQAALLAVFSNGGYDIVFTKGSVDLNTTTTPAAGKWSIGFNSGYRIYNNMGATKTFRMFMAGM